MRSRLEDLGRILVLLEKCLDNEVFQDRRVRNKDFTEWFDQQNENEKEEIIHNFVYGISCVQEELYDIREIALGFDPLNVPECE